MKKILFSILAGMAFTAVAHAQESVYPASKQTAPIIIMNGTKIDCGISCKKNCFD